MNFDWSHYFNTTMLQTLIRVSVIIVVGLTLTYLLAYFVGRLLPARLSKQRIMIINRAILYTGFVSVFFIVISELNINLAAIFGAAGVIGLVVGVASQTSIGNIVSGFFLVSEKSFEIGDLIMIGDKTGTVYSIDLLSIKIRTADNLLIRIPNQLVITGQLTNLTKFPIRRVEVDLSVAYKEDLQKVKSILERIAHTHPLCLDEPVPYIAFRNFGDSGIEIKFGVWVERANFLKVRNALFMAIKNAFDEEGIEMPFPHVSIYAGEATRPIPVTLNEKEAAS